MDDSILNELQALDRIMYLLEENSFLHLSQSDSQFAQFIDALYMKIDEQQAVLKQSLQA